MKLHGQLIRELNPPLIKLVIHISTIQNEEKKIKLLAMTQQNQRKQIIFFSF